MVCPTLPLTYGEQANTASMILNTFTLYVIIYLHLTVMWGMFCYTYNINAKHYTLII
jgi:hypothetical protein